MEVVFEVMAGRRAGRRGRSVYYTAAWQSLRREALRRAGWRCAICGGYGREVHHLVPLHAGGDLLPGLDGVRVLCRDCHRGRHETERRAEWNGLLARVRGEL